MEFCITVVNPLVRIDLCFSGRLGSAAKVWCSLCVVTGILVVVPRVRWADDMDDGKEREKPEHPRAKANVFSALTFWYDCFILSVRPGMLYVSVRLMLNLCRTFLSCKKCLLRWQGFKRKSSCTLRNCNLKCHNF